MNNWMNIAVTGYFGTGSSAVIDLLREYDCITLVPFVDSSYEHIPFYVSGGLFDVCTLLTHGNTPYTSDMVINNFITAMTKLYKYDYSWFGSYKKLFSQEFLNICMNFVNSISCIRAGKSTNHIVRSSFSPIKAVAQILEKFLFGIKFNTYGVKYIYDGKPSYLALPTKDELYNAARIFSSSYCKLFGNAKIKVFDHLIWPNQIDEFEKCFNDSFKFIVVNRDPRDVYLLNKYIWPNLPSGNGVPHFSTEVHSFIDEWRQTVVKDIKNPNCFSINYESLLYEYDKTCSLLEQFLGIDGKNHTRKNTKLVVSESIENTQIFNADVTWAEEVQIIFDNLNDYCYRFPFRRSPNIEGAFDNPNDLIKKKKNRRR